MLGGLSWLPMILFCTTEVVMCVILGTRIINPENIFFRLKFCISIDGYPGKLGFIFW